MSKGELTLPQNHKVPRERITVTIITYNVSAY